MGKTNSNSITAILINKLNYRKSGFRTEILKKWNLTGDLVFHDGTHSSVPGLDGTKPDIIGKIGEKICVIIEVKANLHEPLQESQKKNGRYEQFVNDSDRHLIYIVPDGYEHIDELPDVNSKIHIFKWSKIYEIAKEYDNTGFTDQIDYFVESQFPKSGSVLSKGDATIFLSPSIIGQVNRLYNEKKDLVDEFSKSNSSLFYNYEYDCLGWSCGVDNKRKYVWIGLCTVKGFECSFFICIWIKDGNAEDYKLDGYEEMKNYFLDQKESGVDIYIPIRGDNINFIKNYFKGKLKDVKLEYFDELINSNDSGGEKDIKPLDIERVESLYLKINELMGNFEKNGSTPIKKQSKFKCHQDLGWWYDFKDRGEPKSVWIGIGNVEKSKSSFFMCVWIPEDEKSKYEFNGEEDKDYFLDHNGEDFYIPITEEDNGIPEFLYSETADDQQKKFNKLMSDNINKLLKMLGKN